MNTFTEQQVFQLDRAQLRSLSAFVEAVEHVRLLPPPAHVKSRFVEGRRGDLRLNRTDDGLHIWVPDDGWPPLPSDRLHVALHRAIADLDRLESAPPAVAW